MLASKDQESVKLVGEWEKLKTASPADKARTARKETNGSDETDSQADKARTAKFHETASQADKARTARKNKKGESEEHAMSAAPFHGSPSGLSLVSLVQDHQPSPHGLSSHGSRSVLQRLKKAVVDKSSYKLLELFSPPRVTSEGAKQGFSTTQPAAFDKKVGWNFLDARDRAHLWEVLRSQAPDCVLMTPECKPFSTMMESNWDRMDPVQRDRMQREGLAMYHFCIQVAQFQLDHGRDFIIEQPGFASSRQTYATKWLLEQKGVIRFLFDQCETGLQVSEDGPSRKTTGLITNHLGIAAVLSEKQCSGRHHHIPLENGRPAKAAIFGDQLVRCIIKGLTLASSVSFFWRR